MSMRFKLFLPILASIDIITVRTLAADQAFSPAGPASPSRVVDTTWMAQAKYGIFLHYQHRILLGYCIRTKPQFPEPSQMTAEQWHRFVDGFDVKGFARQMAEGQVGWVIFCLDDHYFAWPCAPNQAFSRHTGYAPGQKCSQRDLILELAEALNEQKVKLSDARALAGARRSPLAWQDLLRERLPRLGRRQPV